MTGRTVQGVGNVVCATSWAARALCPDRGVMAEKTLALAPSS